MNYSLWHNILSHLSSKIDINIFNTFLRPLSLDLSSKDNFNVTLIAPNKYIADYVNSHYKKLLLSAFSDNGIKIKEVKVIFKTEKTKTPSPLCNLNKRFTFDSFVVGPNSNFAKSAAYAVALSPGKTRFNPLVIYSDVGLGKTHLLQAIGNFILENNSDLQIIYISAEEFYLNFIDAIKNNNINSFSSLFKSSNVLLIDDIQFLAGKESTQEEFFYLFNTLFQEGKQIVLTSNTHPSQLKGLHDRVVSRLQWGLCVDIQPPDLETRVAILKKKSEEDNLNIREDILYYIANNVSSNIRELEGVLIRLLAFASITKSDVTIEMVKNILKENVKKEIDKISLDKIIEKCAEYYNISVNSILEKNRLKEVALCRQIAMYIAKTVTNNSLKTIGLNFGGRDHSTVVHAIKTIENLKKEDASISKDIESIISSLT
ncbi:MAG: chromosomal replication initiator protein DnaA [Chitinispirillaceae bacterium]|nr:chromosomal replication initiator protein DnaA [Chitinispirillaceae bacterium]